MDESSGTSTSDSLTKPNPYMDALKDLEAVPVPDVGKMLTDDAHAEMLKGIRSWGIGLLLLGVLHLILGQFLDAPWGILLILVGLMSFVFREAPMYVIYGVALAWAAISNLLSLELGLVLFALFQFYWTYRVMQRYFRYRKAQVGRRRYLAETGGSSSHPERAAKVFPWAALLLGGGTLAGLIFFVIGLFLLYANMVSENALVVLLQITVYMGVLALGLGAASLFSGYKYRLASALGVVAGSIVLLAWFGLMAFATLSP